MDVLIYPGAPRDVRGGWHARLGAVKKRRNDPVQMSLSDLEYMAKRKVTKRKRLLGGIEAITPWAELLSALSPHYPKGEGRGRQSIGLEQMLRMYIVQQTLRQPEVIWNVAIRPGKCRALGLSQEIDRLRGGLETIKASIRAKVEHPFHIIKNRFGMTNASNRGLAKNTTQLMTLFAFTNPMIAKRRLLQFDAQGAS